MRIRRRVVVFTMFFCLASSGAMLSLSLEPVELVPWETLADFIIDISGWAKDGDLVGNQVPVPTKSQVIQPYASENGNRTLEVHIFDSDESMIVLMPVKMMMMHNRKDSEVFAETITIQGYPGVKTYDYQQKKADLILLILDRFVLQMFGENFSEAEVAELEAIAESHDIEGIAELGR